ncbi:hypothetical protein AB0D86_01500 [Streptomyces sp. NPDC048324]|uniref:hypothetical protein n=1 Tax=Streptomyces sp. NPDC048324 TaxID=3157205 RepID=UPI0034130DF3
MAGSARDHFGTPLEAGDAVELFRVSGGPTGGDALGWRGGIPGKVATVNDPQYPGRVLVELDKPTGYPAPYDKAREWAELSTTVKAAETA